MDSVFKVKPCDTTKSKFVIVSTMLYINLTYTWNYNVTVVTNLMVNKVKTEKAGVVTNYKAACGPSSNTFDICLMNLREMFLEKICQKVKGVHEEQVDQSLNA